MQPIIIIGAGRSGTNILRDILTTIPGFGTWPCDEINYIWRYGNASSPTDELQPDQASPKTISYIRKAFAKLARQKQLSYVVEKTCANSLRVPFVDTIVPEAKYIFIVRDGRDVVSSAIRRWTAPLDLVYISKKARFVPVADLPYYASRYIGNRIYRLFSKEERLAFWGPRFKGMDDLLRNCSLEEICAFQWVSCVQEAGDFFESIPAERYRQIQYEDFVTNPIDHLMAIGKFLDQSFELDFAQEKTKMVSARSIGNWRKGLTQDQLNNIYPIVTEMLERYGYDI